jgi:hypothetical protein
MKPSKATSAAVPLTTKAVAITRDGTFLSEAVEITITNGVVTDVKVLTRGPDIPAQSIGKANSALWDHFRTENTFSAQAYRKEQV